jgi:putative ABC transport system substrate-binding protein
MTVSIGRRELLAALGGAATAWPLDAAFATMAQQQVRALLFGSDTFFVDRRDRVASLAAHYRIPAMSCVREYVEAGGLIAYGNRIADMYRLVGIYVGRILKGEKPADLPVQESTKFELVINLKTAKALGLEVPAMLLARADEVIE